MNHVCKQCKFYKWLEGAIGMCRYNPPSAHVVGMTPQGQPQIMMLLPQVQENHMCGHYQTNLILEVRSNGHLKP